MIMTNKEKLNKAIEQDINMQDCYNEIIRKIGESEEMKKKNNMWKWSLVPICLVVVISGFLVFNSRNDNKTILENKPYIDEVNDVTLNINEITNNVVGTPKIDAEVKIVRDNDADFPIPYGIINIPKDLDKTYKYILYGRENKDSKDYNKLINYEIGYSDDLDRSIQIAFSKDHKPVRDYHFSDEGSKSTTINGVELKIYKFENIYFTEFEFNGYNFDIETTKITEQELSSLLTSILK